MENKKDLTLSLEKYLLAIYELSKNNDALIVKDVSNYLNIGGPSTADAIKALAKKGYIDYVPYKNITLNNKGYKKVEEKLKRRAVLKQFLKQVMCVDENEIENNIEQIEYAFDDELMKKFVAFVEFLDSCSCKTPKWLNSFKYFAQNNKLKEKCLICKNSSSCCCEGCKS